MLVYGHAVFLIIPPTVKQNIYTRQGVFDGAPILGPFQLLEDKYGKPTRLWLNIEVTYYPSLHHNALSFLQNIVQNQRFKDFVVAIAV